MFNWRAWWSAEDDDDKAIRAAIEEKNKNFHPDYIRSRIIDENEKLYFIRLRRKFLVAWAALGNVIIASLLALMVIFDPYGDVKYASVSALVLVVSVIGSLGLLYRQHKNIRRVQVRIRKLNVAHSRNKQNVDENQEDSNLLLEHKQYRDELPEVISEYREEANRYRKWHNGFQSIIIVGSVSTSAITTASVAYEEVRWAAVAVSFIVGLASGFTGYFKYRERSFNLQQTADSIEREYESVELRVGRYRKLTEAEAFAEFANYVEQLRDEQNKRQQQLDQPVEAKREEAAYRVS
ncbi:DUF4231 domain-containing protein [Actinopolyspora saharensis]|uniref:DUF4231 domain-containing protein n=1 Tax=Actinopolyspora saharensis TaxID=995062 RepID=UPI001C318323|nr:DUF4231 domain-containing protein [Actinopolyspora saharensis]